jgi:hypothetical protein
MIVTYIVDELIRAVNAAINTSNGKWDNEYVYNLLPQLRAEAIIISYNGSRNYAANRTISPSWLQQVDITIEPTEQDTKREYIVVQVPKVIRINDKTDGFVYVGNDDLAIDFKRAYTKSEISYLKQRGFLRGKEIIYIGVGNVFEIYGNKSLKSFQIQGVFTDPTMINSYNPLQDDYPIDEATLAIMKDLFVSKARAEMAMPQEIVADAADTNSVRQVKSNIQ